MPRDGPCCPPSETAVGLVLEGQSSVSTQDQSLKAGEFVH